MNEDINIKVKKILDNYLKIKNHRKTPERYIILDTIYNMSGHFTLKELNENIEKNKFTVSRSTLFNAMRLFIKLRLVIKHKIANNTMYEACLRNENHCHLVCTKCGNVYEVKIPTLINNIENTKFKNFTNEGFSLYIYGICKNCKQKN